MLWYKIGFEICKVSQGHSIVLQNEIQLFVASQLKRQKKLQFNRQKEVVAEQLLKQLLVALQLKKKKQSLEQYQLARTHTCY